MVHTTDYVLFVMVLISVDIDTYDKISVLQL